MFVAREKELAALEEAYQSDTFQCVIVYGRRRVGKTALLRKFVKDKNNVFFFSARETTAQENLIALSRALLDNVVMTSYESKGGDGVFADTPVPQFATYEDALTYVFANARKHRTILVIDEYPYLAKSYKGASSLLQELIDKNKDSSQLMIVLCGSSMSFMKKQVLGEKSPLYGRRTAQIRLEPFDYRDAAALVESDNPVRLLELYGLVGGVPLYLEQLDGHRTTQWNIANRMLGPGKFLFAEPESFMLQEVQSPAAYNAIVSALANGRPRPTEIANATGIEAPNVSNYLKALIELGIVAKDTPVGKANKKAVIYRLCDNLFRFWYTFAPRYGAAIESGMSEQVAERIITRGLSDYMGHVFEDVCRQWAARAIADGRFDMIPSQIGNWWGVDPQAKEQVDVDVVSLGIDGELLAGECKWTTAPVDTGILETLQERAHLITDRPRRIELVLFAKSGFTKGCIESARKAGNVTLVGLEDLF